MMGNNWKIKTPNKNEMKNRVSEIQVHIGTLGAQDRRYPQRAKLRITHYQRATERWPRHV